MLTRYLLRLDLCTVVWMEIGKEKGRASLPTNLFLFTHLIRALSALQSGETRLVNQAPNYRTIFFSTQSDLLYPVVHFRRDVVLFPPFLISLGQKKNDSVLCAPASLKWSMGFSWVRIFQGSFPPYPYIYI